MVGINMALNVAFISGSGILCIILTGLILQGASVLAMCTQESISVCTSEEQIGVGLYVDFEKVPLHEGNLSCLCYVFIGQTGRINFQFSTPRRSSWPSEADVRVDNVPFQNSTKGWSDIKEDEYKIIHFKGETTNGAYPQICLKMVVENKRTNLTVKCLVNGNTSIPTKTATTQKSTDHTTVPTSGSTRSHSVTTGRTDKTTVHSTNLSTATGSDTTGRTDKTTVYSTTLSTATDRDTTGSTERITATEEPGSVDIAVIAGAAGGGFVVLVVVVIITILLCKRSTKQQKQPDRNVQYNPNQEDDTYNVENAMYVSADLDSATYDKPDSEVTYDTADDVMYDKSSSGHLYDSTNTKPQRTAVQNVYSSVLTNKRNNPHFPDNGDTYNPINHGANPPTAPPNDTYDTARH